MYIIFLLFYNSLALDVNGRQVTTASASGCSLSKLLWPKSHQVDLEGCSIKKGALEELHRQGILRDLTKGGRLRGKAKDIARKMNEIYKANDFFSSYVVDYHVTQDGERLQLKCIENGVPKSNFKFFIRDDTDGGAIDVSGMEIVKSSSFQMPKGKFKEQQNGALMDALFGYSETLVQFNEDTFKSLKSTGLWKNLEYALWRSKDGQFHLHCFADGAGMTRRIDYTLANLLSKEGAQLRVSFRNMNLLDYKLLAEVRTNIGIREWYRSYSKHKVNMSLTYNTLRKALWSDGVGQNVVATVTSTFSIQDLLSMLGRTKGNCSDQNVKPLMSVTFLANTWHDRCRLQVAADSEMLHFKTFKKTYSVTHGNLPFISEHNVVMKAPIDGIRERNQRWRQRLYVRSNNTLSMRLGNKEAAVSFRLGSKEEQSGFRGTTPNLGGMYLMLAADFMHLATKMRPWANIKPGIFVDLMCSFNQRANGSIDHQIAYSCGLLVNVLGISVSLALSEVPRNMATGFRGFLTALRKSSYLGRI